MKKAKAQKPDQFVYHLSKPLAGYGIPRKPNQKVNPNNSNPKKKR